MHPDSRITASRPTPFEQEIPELRDYWSLNACEPWCRDGLPHECLRPEPGENRCCWTTQRTSDGFYLSFVYSPGDGSADWREWDLEVASIRRHETRQEAQARAEALHAFYGDPAGSYTALTCRG